MSFRLYNLVETPFMECLKLWEKDKKQRIK